MLKFVLFAVNQMNGELLTILGGLCLLGKLTVFLCVAVANLFIIFSKHLVIFLVSFILLLAALWTVIYLTWFFKGFKITTFMEVCQLT